MTPAGVPTVLRLQKRWGDGGRMIMLAQVNVRFFKIAQRFTPLSRALPQRHSGVARIVRARRSVGEIASDKCQFNGEHLALSVVKPLQRLVQQAGTEGPPVSPPPLG